ncbi:phospholipase A2 inhibitor and Ly6/PLAUR domain-containing protein [Scophthalmus maximus]|uniref:phospholipase A2 inhibitor and Ly6/PLAUR domain-containing protein n=1 Tax=Scophthalmus maximus TaxID=52904 RepID=UPI0015E08A87|nr:phospholipase A2 inhibitor and Ly6/PLAUR domain-containing protein [Scophthalmus maximus]
MMKLLLSLTLIWALSSTGEALVCQTCTTSACTATVPKTCSSETMCITAAIQATSAGTPIQQIIKACASSSLCPATGSQTFSVNLGVSASGLASAACCNTDNCNSAILAVPAVPADNSLQCFSCNPLTSQCNNSVQCKGTENQCFQATVTSGSTTTSVLGCVSSNICAAAISQGQLPFEQSVGNITGSACCGTNLCNTLSSAASDTCRIRLTMIHLLIGLLVFTLY